MEEIKFKFEDLKVYQKSLDFINLIYKTCEKFPKEENYRLTSQFIRAANSIALNIAEGSGDTNLQFNRFLQIAIGSVKECVVCATIAKNQKYISFSEEKIIRSYLEELSKMITSLQKYLKSNTND
ncbi:four helix bundle protein [Lutibacter sp. Hel_I_33_5]|uniref:four helix bundle protein n=1 Tax=Lutibacter sp. Hel_I_33_5 TaxID=1566289 RepID=UPI0011A746FC|nr:four helix bundle protein [Lutibacter sp. Hel_I_33_5]TVZ56641.1 four helix bundle protein [Lutibacter sp. Hel_I_33_5]